MRCRLDARRTSALVAAPVAVLLAGCVTVTRRPEPAAGVELRQRTSEIAEGTLRWVESGDPDLRAVVFVHGTPGSWGAFGDFLVSARLLEVGRLVSVDRPGFGRSGRGVAVPSLAAQAAALLPVLDAVGDAGPPILVGHSLGAPIAARVAMDFPDRVGALVLVSPSVDPELERLTWYQRLARHWPLRRLIPLDFRTALAELVPLRGELAAMAGRWGEIRAPVIVVQGGRDHLVDPRNADFLERVIAASLVEVVRDPRAGHLIPWKQPELIVDAVVDLAARLRHGRTARER